MRHNSVSRGFKQCRHFHFRVQFARETERQPQGGDRIGAQAVEEDVRRDQHDMLRGKLHDPVAEIDAMAPLLVEVETPERAEHAGKIPIGVVRQMAGLVQRDARPARRRAQRIELDAHAGKRPVVGANVGAAFD